jgi:hypothetical protein
MTISEWAFIALCAVVFVAISVMILLGVNIATEVFP